jgi:hypothetical protein
MKKELDLEYQYCLGNKKKICKSCKRNVFHYNINVADESIGLKWIDETSIDPKSKMCQHYKFR